MSDRCAATSFCVRLHLICTKELSNDKSISSNQHEFNRSLYLFWLDYFNVCISKELDEIVRLNVFICHHL